MARMTGDDGMTTLARRAMRYDARAEALHQFSALSP
jgi:hypothetical protein